MTSLNTANLTLSELQQQFQNAVLNRPQKAPVFIVDTPGISSTERFKVYTEAYRLRLIEALSSDYPALKHYLGDDEFDMLARAYIDAVPSNHFSIRWFGRQLSQFLKDTILYIDRPGLKELASFEWALNEAFDAVEHTSISSQCLIAIEPSLWPSLRFDFHPSMRRLDLYYNVPQLWQASNQQEALPDFVELAELQAWIVWRRELKLLYCSLSAQQAFCLDAFIQGKCFAEVCSGLCAWLDEEQVAISAAGYIQAWVRDGWIVGVDTS